MIRMSFVLLLALLPPLQYGTKVAVPAKSAPETNPADGPAYTADGELKLPERYREWIYLTSGLDMSYNPSNAGMGHSMFDNVFVNPGPYRAFMATGTWPDKTVLVLESRMGETGNSINVKGKTQAADLMGFEVHVKDATLPGGWGFFAFDNPKSAKRIDRKADCYSCHEQHAAVDTTFVQFYPTLIGVAKAKGTLSKEYLGEMGGAQHSK